jgi:hypothetical protein
MNDKAQQRQRQRQHPKDMAIQSKGRNAFSRHSFQTQYSLHAFKILPDNGRTY